MSHFSWLFRGTLGLALLGYGVYFCSSGQGFSAEQSSPTLERGLQVSYAKSYTLAHLFQRLDLWQLPTLTEANAMFTTLTQTDVTQRPTPYAQALVCLAKAQLEASWQFDALLQPSRDTPLGGVSPLAPSAWHLPYTETCSQTLTNYERQNPVLPPSYRQRRIVVRFLQAQSHALQEGFQGTTPTLATQDALRLTRYALETLPREMSWHWVGMYLSQEDALHTQTASKLTEDEYLQQQLAQARTLHKLHQGFRFPMLLLQVFKRPLRP